VREAKKRNVKISAEAMPHHIALTDAAIEGYDTNFKMNPPLREKIDQDALLAGLADDTIEILASDHAPHASYEKEVEFAEAPFGIVGLETELGIFAKILIEGRVLDWPQMLAKLTINPARLLKLDRGTLAPGAVADITLIDPKHAWKVDAAKFHSLSRNTPFHGWDLPARATHTIVDGHVVWSLEKGFVQVSSHPSIDGAVIVCRQLPCLGVGIDANALPTCYNDLFSAVAVNIGAIAAVYPGIDTPHAARIIGSAKSPWYFQFGNNLAAPIIDGHWLSGTPTGNNYFHLVIASAPANGLAVCPPSAQRLRPPPYLASTLKIE
jgi:hypothetical protein